MNGSSWRRALCAASLAALGFLAAVSTAANAQTIAPGGPLGAVMEYDSAVSPAQTVYRPRDMARARSLPIVAWGNGACADNGGAGARQFLLELASSGYLIIAPGKPGPDSAIEPTRNKIDPPAMPAGAPAAAPPPGPGPGNDPTQSVQLLQAVDWATAENKRAGSIYFGKIDPTKVAIMGHSCGGLQALDVSADPRVTTTMIWNSGIYNRPGGRSGVRIEKSALAKLHAPIAYFQGGPTDIAYENAVDDYGRINNLPIFMGELPVGHGGTFRQANGGAYAQAGKAWLDWRLKGDKTAATWFSGASCKLCADPKWKVSRKRID
jgi:dienelactone hydrolase